MSTQSQRYMYQTNVYTHLCYSTHTNNHTCQIAQANPINQLSEIKFISVIRQLAQDKENASNSNSPLFQFNMNEGAATHNAAILKSFNYDLQAAIQAQLNSSVVYGSKFCHWSKLEPLLKFHPLWLQAKR